jgi:hypothetical protein
MMNQQLRLKSVILVPVCLWLFTIGCSAASGSPPESRYFLSPQEAVAIITELLGKEDWATLSLYYDLSGTGIDRSELESGRFFVRSERPVNAHPGISWKYKQPFTPGFSLDHIESSRDPGVVTVVVSIEFDQGGGMKQRGVDSFKMRKTEKGYQVLPK